MVRLLAFRAGVVKMSGESFSHVAAEILHFMGTIVAHAYETCVWCTHDGNISDYSDDDEDEEDTDVGNYFATRSPPHREDEDGKLKCVIIARQIEDAAVKLGMKPVLGFGFGTDGFGTDIWAVSSSTSCACTDGVWCVPCQEKKEKEIEKSMGEYFSDGNPWESESDESSAISLMEGDSFDSDGENNRGDAVQSS